MLEETSLCYNRILSRFLRDSQCQEAHNGMILIYFNATEYTLILGYREWLTLFALSISIIPMSAQLENFMHSEVLLCCLAGTCD